MEVICYGCRERGHYVTKCPNKQKGNSKNPKSKTSTGEDMNAFNAIFMSRNFNDGDIYVDSGASVHLTARKDWLQNVKTDGETKEITVANKSKMSTSVYGSLFIKTVVGKEQFNITINKIYYCPGITTNLLSVGQLIKNGNKVEFTENGCVITNKQGKAIATADSLDNVYELNFEKQMPQSCLNTINLG